MKVLFMPVKWSDSVEPIDGGSWNVAFVQDLAKKTKAFYLENSYGKVDMDITVTPWLTIPMTNAASTWTDTFIAGAAADATLRAAGFVVEQYERIVFFSERNPKSGYKGFASKNRGWVFNCMGSEYAAHSVLHELGHTFSVGHPQVIQQLGTRSGNTITVPPLSVTVGGTRRDLYDASTVMGYDYQSPHFSGPEKVFLGWVTPTVHLGGDVTYSLTPLAISGGSCYVVKVPMARYSPMSQRTYWIERREDVGQGYWFKISPELRGVIIRVQGDFGSYMATRIDTTPSRPGDGRTYSSNLLPGETFTDGTISIECGADGAVRIRDVGAVVVPPPVAYPAAGTRLSQMCRGVDLWGVFASGTGGTYEQLIEANSVTCGYAVPTNPNIAILPALQPAVAGLKVGEITQRKLDAVQLLAKALVKDA